MTISPEPGDIWLAEVAYTSGLAAKRRPVLVLWLDAEDAVVAVVTSVVPKTPTDVPLSDWKRVGLRVPSTVRLMRLDSLERSLLLRRVGRVPRHDASELRRAWSKHMILRL